MAPLIHREIDEQYNKMIIVLTEESQKVHKALIKYTQDIIKAVEIDLETKTVEVSPEHIFELTRNFLDEISAITEEAKQAMKLVGNWQ